MLAKPPAKTKTRPSYSCRSQQFPAAASIYPQLRLMGSKHRLLPWIHEILRDISFTSALDGFAGSGAVAYLLKCMGKRVVANDFLTFSSVICMATVANSHLVLEEQDVEHLLSYDPRHRHFIERTFRDIFYTPEDLRFLDRLCWNAQALPPKKAALAMSALLRSCVKRQPRGVFTAAGDVDGHKDGRRDLRLSLREHFLEQVRVYNGTVFRGHRGCQATRGDIFEAKDNGYDLVYFDPPYVPRADDNCYIKRYHFLEGLSCYWEGQRILHETKVKKIAKRFTPFSYRRTAIDAFERLFRKFADSIIVLSYSSNGYPDLPVIRNLLAKVKSRTDVFEKQHVYHFGTHSKAVRRRASEYILLGY